MRDDDDDNTPPGDDELDALFRQLNDVGEVAETIAAGFLSSRRRLLRRPPDGRRFAVELKALLYAAPASGGWAELAGLGDVRPGWWARVAGHVAAVWSGLPAGPLHPHRGRRPRGRGAAQPGHSAGGRR